jgi:hypothetical protein
MGSNERSSTQGAGAIAPGGRQSIVKMADEDRSDRSTIDRQDGHCRQPDPGLPSSILNTEARLPLVVERGHFKPLLQTRAPDAAVSPPASKAHRLVYEC